MMAIAKSLSQAKTFPTMSTSQFRGLVLLFSLRDTKWLFCIITSDESISSLVCKQKFFAYALRLCVWVTSQHYNFYRPRPQSRIPIFLEPFIFVIPIGFSSTWNQWIHLPKPHLFETLSSVDSFLDPTDLVNSCGRLKAWNFLIQQSPKLAPKLKWKLANSKWQHYRLLTCIF